MLKGSTPSAKLSSRTESFLGILALCLMITVAGTNAAGFSIVDSVKEFFGLETISATAPEPMAPFSPTVVTVGGGASGTCPFVPTATYTTPPSGVSFSNWSRGSGVTCGSAADGLSGSGFNTADAATSFAGNKFYKITITADATHTFTLSSITWLGTISSSTGTFTVKTSNNGGAATDFGTATAGVTGSSISSTFNGTVNVAAGTSVDVFLIPSNLSAAGTTCRFKNNSTITVDAAAVGGTATNTPTPTNTGTSTATSTPTDTPAGTATNTDTPTPTSTSTNTATATATSTATSTPTPPTPNTCTSIATGGWASAGTWTNCGGTFPGAIDTAIIDSGTTVTMGAAASATNVTVNSTGTLDASTFTLSCSGTFTLSAGSTFKQGGGVSTQPGATRSFDPASTYIFNGSQSSISAPGNFGNLVWSSSGNASPGTNLTIAGDLTLLNSLQLRGSTGTTARSHTVAGNVVIDGSSAVLVGTNAAATPNNGVWTIGGSVTTQNGGILRGNNPSAGATGTFNIAGNLINNGSIEHGTGTGLFVVNFNNAALPQNISGTAITGFQNVGINNAVGVSLSTNVTLTGTLTLSQGNITTAANTLTVALGGTVSRTSGHVVGNLQKSTAIVTNNGSITFEIGDASVYAPVNFATTTGLITTTLTASTTAGDHPDIANSGLIASKTANRYWTVTTNTPGSFTNANLTFNFDPADLDGGANTANFVVRKFDAPSTWTNTTTGTQTSTSTQATGVSGFSDFAVGEPFVPTPTNTATDTPTPTSTNTSTPTNTATDTPTNTATDTPTPTATETFTPTATNTATDTPTPTATETFTPTATNTATDTPTPTATETFTPTATNTATDTPTPTATETFTPTATNTATDTPTPTATETSTPTSTNTSTPTNTATDTPTPTATETFTPTATNTSTPTETATDTPTPTATETSTATATSTATSTNTPTATPTCIPVSMPDVPSLSGVNVTIPVNTGDVTGNGVISTDFTVTYDPAVLSPPAGPTLGVTMGPVATSNGGGRTLTAFSPSAGTLKVSVFGIQDMTGAGVLVNLNFNVVGLPYTSSGVSFAAFKYNETGPCTSTTNGSVTVNPGSIAGTVNYGNPATGPDPRGVPNVLVSGAGSPPVSDTTGPSGTYSLTGFGTGSYTITPSKSGGDNGSITSFDAAKIAQYVTGSISFTAAQQVVADVSGTGGISSFDAALIARYVASIGPPTGSTGSWIFSPTSNFHSTVYANITGEDYAALLMGDVSGNWGDPSPYRPANGPERSAAVSLPRLVAPLGKDVIVPVSIQGVADKGVISYQFDLRYDPSAIQPKADLIDLIGTVSRGFTAVANAKEPGFLRVVVYGPQPLGGNGVLLNLRFTAVGSPGFVSPLTLERIMLNEGDPGTTATSGEVVLSTATAD